MKVLTRAIAVLMLVAMLAALMAACGEDNSKGYTDPNILGTWKQTDEVDGNWIWTFNEDGTCKLVGETTGFTSEGTYKIENDTNGKIHINLDGWSEEQLFTYTATTKKLNLTGLNVEYYCDKQ